MSAALSELTQRLITEAITAIGRDVAFLVQTGSRAYGTSTELSDTDLIGFYVETDHELYGLQRAQKLKYRVLFEDLLDDRSRNAGSIIASLSHGTCLQQLGTGAGDSPAGYSDIEILLVPLREYTSLAAAGNPEFVSPLFVDFDSDLMVYCDTRGAYLVQQLREMVLTKHACFRLAGYARAQRDVVQGASKRRTNRLDLVRAHGYDTKAGSHLLRLLLVGHRVLQENTVHLPMPPEDIERVMRVRRGEVPLMDLLVETNQLEQDLTVGTEQSGLPDEVNMHEVGELLTEVHTYPLLAEVFEEGARDQLGEQVSYTHQRDAVSLFNPYDLEARTL